MNKIENIITIDFDIIMSPSIQIYNSFVSEEKAIDDFAQYNNPLLAYCDADLNIYSNLSFYIFRMFENLKENQIHFIFNHEQICDYLSKEKKYNIYNIDHHHDCGYPNSATDLYCGNWVLKLKEWNMLNNYIWIGDVFSEDIPDNFGNKILYNNFDLYSLPKPDKLIICASFTWVPKQFIPLFYMWLDFYNIYFNEKKPLIIEGQYKKNML